MKRKIIDLLDRAGATFAQAFLAAITLGTFSDINAVKLAGIAGAYAVAKYLLVEANKYLDSNPPRMPEVVIGNPPEKAPMPEPTPPAPPSA